MFPGFMRNVLQYVAHHLIFFSPSCSTTCSSIAQTTFSRTPHDLASNALKFWMMFPTQRFLDTTPITPIIRAYSWRCSMRVTYPICLRMLIASRFRTSSTSSSMSYAQSFRLSVFITSIVGASFTLSPMFCAYSSSLSSLIAVLIRASLYRCAVRYAYSSPIGVFAASGRRTSFCLSPMSDTYSSLLSHICTPIF